MSGISGPEFVVLVVVAAVVLGPDRLPRYTQQLIQMIRQLRRMALGASEQVRAELGPEFEEIDWQKLDPRQYDPRRIVREALSESFDPDDPLGMKSVTRDLRDSAEGVRESVTSTVDDTKQSLKAPSRRSPSLTSGGGPSPDQPPVWDPDTL